MNCPRCTAAGGEMQSAYRGGFTHGTVVALVDDTSGGSVIQRCPSCRGAFVEYEELKAIENRSKVSAATSASKRTWDPPTEAIACPSCQSETTRREWSIGTLLFVDVCIECRGVWLDSGELEAIGGNRR